MQAVFQEAQLSLAKHKRCFEKLSVLLASSTVTEFAESLFSCLACVLTVFKREPAVERIIEFVVRFLTQAGTLQPEVQEELINLICLRLLGLGSATDKAIRFRTTQIVSSVLNQLPEDAEVSDDLFVAVEETMSLRCRDKVPIVRALALRALFRLQDPQTPDDPITAELLRSMTKDPSKEVRMAAISTIAPSKLAIRALLERTRDCNTDVQLHALVTLRDKVEMKWLSIAQRAALLSDALNSRQPDVRAKCIEVLHCWLRKVDSQPMKLLKGLDVASYELMAEAAIRALLEDPASRKLLAKTAESWNELQPESLLCLRVYLEWLRGRATDDLDDFEAALPELPTFCKVLTTAAAAYDASGKAASFVLVQLLRVCPLLDMANEHGRVQLEASLCGLLKNLQTAEEMLRPLVGALRAACCGDVPRFQALALELISEVEDPLEADCEGASSDPAEAERRLDLEQQRMLKQARLVELHAEVKERVQEEDFEAAAELKKEAGKLQAEIAEAAIELADTPEEEANERCMRTLYLTELLLQSPLVRPSEREALKQRLLPVLQSPRPELRALALRCLGLLCLSSKEQAIELWTLFEKALVHDQPQAQLAALGACVDLLLTHSVAALLPAVLAEPPLADEPLPPREDAAAPAVVDLFLPLLRLPAGPLRSAAALGACKLLHTGALESSALMSRLLVLFFYPEECNSAPHEEKAVDAHGDAVLEPSQFLSVFFATAPAEQIAPAAMLALQQLSRASAGSPEASVSAEALGSFALALLRPPDQDTADQEAATSSAHVSEDAAIALCCEALEAQAESDVRLLTKLLSQLLLPPAESCTQLPVLLVLLAQLEEQISDKRAVANVQRVRARFSRLVEEMPAAAGTGQDGGCGARETDGTDRVQTRAERIRAAYSACRASSANDNTLPAAMVEPPSDVPPPQAAPSKKLMRKLSTKAGTKIRMEVPDENVAANARVVA
mmetsp:Transcript_29835/g.64194  ORF Transcript_29835/g.64194 Transcript_29835/m.64194 type:complete len:963 (-) Transcript_29835:643-3531(-)